MYELIFMDALIVLLFFGMIAEKNKDTKQCMTMGFIAGIAGHVALTIAYTMG